MRMVFPKLEVQSMKRPASITEERMEKRLQFWSKLQSDFVASRRGGAAASHHEVYQGAMKLMNSEDARAFNLDEEPKEVREAYGANVFGQGCLLARRLGPARRSVCGGVFGNGFWHDRLGHTQQQL